MTDALTDTVAHMQDFAKLLRKAAAIEARILIHGDPMLAARFISTPGASDPQFEYLADGIERLADEIQAECDDAAADSQRSAA